MTRLMIRKIGLMIFYAKFPCLAHLVDNKFPCEVGSLSNNCLWPALLLVICSAKFFGKNTKVFFQ